jgi:hypothetical protein
MYRAEAQSGQWLPCCIRKGVEKTLGPASKSPKVGGEEARRRSFFCKPSGRNIRILKKTAQTTTTTTTLSIIRTREREQKNEFPNGIPALDDR